MPTRKPLAATKRTPQSAQLTFLVERLETFMTTAQPLAAEIKVLGLVCALLLCGCGSKATTYHPDGAETNFCVPNDIDVTPSRFQKGKTITGGFTLDGCYSPAGSTCIGPKNLISVAVVAKPYFPGRRLEDLHPTSPLLQAATEGWGQARHLGRGVLAIPDRLDPTTVYLWDASEPVATTPLAGSELMAACDEKGAITCSRVIHGKDYGITYSFFSGKELPTSFESLDKHVIDGVEALRCQ